MRKILALIPIVLALCACAGEGRSGLGPGEAPPDFTVTTLSGESFNLSAQRGKAVLLNFWATWCGPCIAEMPELSELYASLQAEGLVVVGIAIDDEIEEVREFAKRSQVPFPLALDTTGKIKRAYKLAGVPETFVISKDGKLVLVPDLKDGSPTVRMKGPRHWAGPASKILFRALLNEPMEEGK